MRKAVWFFAFVACCLAVMYFVHTSRDDISAGEVRENATSRKSVSAAKKVVRGEPGTVVERAEAKKDDEGKPVTAAEARQGDATPVNGDDHETEAEKQVEIFDELTDAWSSSSEGRRVTMADVEKFQSQFRRLPTDRKEECLQRALNLVPDENVMLLAGILFDKSLDKDLIETTFNDILNRDETVKKPIMEQIFKDKSHPCWADVAWILDVTGSIPKLN